LPSARWLPDQLYRDQASLLEPNIEFHVDPVKQFKLDKNQVVTEAGKTHEYDIMVIATGSRMVPDETPGLVEGRGVLLHRSLGSQDVPGAA
jgi:sulfide:quinone oxidoreductase